MPDEEKTIVPTSDLIQSVDALPICSVDVLPGIIPDAPSLATVAPHHASEVFNGKHNNRRLFPDLAIYDAARRIDEVWPSPTQATEHHYPQFSTLYKSIKEYNLPNFLGARIPLKSGLNIDNWYKYLEDYHDPLLCEFLSFGWPLGYNKSVPPSTTTDNHPSALFHLQAVKDFVKTELEYDALIGPFQQPPFDPWFRTSPLMTRAKKGSTERRIIVDLSFPEGASVNDGIDSTYHLGVNITYSLPTISDLITQLQQFGKGAYLWKADLRRAYRQLRSDTTHPTTQPNRKTPSPTVRPSASE